MTIHLMLVLRLLLGRLDEKPHGLLAAEAARSAEQIRTARMEYSVQWPGEYDAGLPHTYFYSFQAAGDDYSTIFHGDEERAVARRPDGERSDQYTYSGAMQSLYLDGSIWHKRDQEPQVRRIRGSYRTMFDMLDPRQLGLSVLGLFSSFDAACHDAGRPLPRYSERQEGEHVIVRADSDDGYELEWRIDPARNWAVTELIVIYEGRVAGREAIELQFVDGCWIPWRVQKFAAHEDGEKLVRTTEVLYAEVNRPEHPQELTPAAIGVEVGTMVVCADPGGVADCTNGYWDGQRVVSAAEYFLRLEAGQLRPGPNIARELGRAVAMTRRWQALGRLSAGEAGPGAAAREPRATTQPTTAPVESEWERYTREFITRFRLSADQREQAMTILRDCQQRAAQHLRNERARFEELDRRSADAGKLTGAQRTGEEEKLAALRAELRAPIDEIFERELKPRLDKLPTTVQRNAAPSGTSAATQPRSDTHRP